MSERTVGTNRYADKRLRARARVQLAARYSSANVQLEGHVTDISPDGLFFASDFLDSQGEVARLFVEVPWREGALELRGEVRWVNETPSGGGMGIKLIDVGLEDRLLLSSLGGEEPAVRDVVVGQP